MGDGRSIWLKKLQKCATARRLLISAFLLAMASAGVLLCVDRQTPLAGVFGGRSAEALAGEMPRGKIVSSAADLRRVVGEAGDGAVILLAPGRYPEIAIGNVRKAGVVTITSADRSRPASIGRLLIRNSSGLIVREGEPAPP